MFQFTFLAIEKTTALSGQLDRVFGDYTWSKKWAAVSPLTISRKWKSIVPVMIHGEPYISYTIVH